MATHTALTVLVLATALTGCSRSSDASASSEGAMETVVAAAATTPPPVQRAANCVVTVEGRVWLDRPCPHEYTAPDLVILNVAPPAGEDFVYLFRDNTDQATASWSGGGGGGHAHDNLGELSRDGHCWINARARICLPPAAEADFDRGW